MDICVMSPWNLPGRRWMPGGYYRIGDAVASQVSPAVYERLILRASNGSCALHAMGAKVRMHICGTSRISCRLASLDLDVIDVDHMVSLAIVAKRSAGRLQSRKP